MWIAAILFLAIFGLLAYLDTRKPKNYPPGPNWLPIIGSAHVLYKLRKKTGLLHLASAELTKQYGNIVGLKVGKDRTVIVYGLQEMREFLQNEDLLGRPNGPYYEIRTWGSKKGVLLTDEDFWQEQRRYVLRNLREFGFGRRNMSSMIEDEAFMMVQRIKDMVLGSKGPLIVPMTKVFGIHILNTLWTMMAGIRYSPDDKEVKNLQSLLNELFVRIDMMGTLFSHFPVLRFIAPDFSGYNLYVKAHEPLWKFISEEIASHKKTFDPDHPRDLIDMYLIMLNSPERPESFSELQLLAICLDLFMAGSETTSKSIGFGFLYLVLNPDVQKKAQEEIDSVVGRDRLPTLNDRPNMPYMEGLVLESVRMMMGRCFGIPHRALKDTKLAGYDIPKGTMVIANKHGILRGSESGLENPDAFMPERYSKNGHVTIGDNYMPFGFGKRRCMGETLAKANLFLFFASLLQNFNFNVPEGHPQPSTDCDDGVTPTPKPFSAHITLRN